MIKRLPPRDRGLDIYVQAAFDLSWPKYSVRLLGRSEVSTSSSSRKLVVINRSFSMVYPPNQPLPHALERKANDFIQLFGLLRGLADRARRLGGLIAQRHQRLNGLAGYAALHDPG